MTARSPRLHDDGFLKFLRKRRCDACGQVPPAGGSNDAAHLKAGSVVHDKPWSGSAKPSDRWATTLCRSCHIRQHAHGDELGWWSAHGIDPFLLAAKLYAEYGGTGGTARGPRKVKPRKPRKDRIKIKSRGFPKGVKQPIGRRPT